MRKIGIDFGTCNIKGAEKKKNGDVAYIKLGKQIDKVRVPNVILYAKKAEAVSVYIGDTALKKTAPEQDKIRNIKSYLQEAHWKRELSFGKEVSAYEVTLDIMKSLYEEIHNTNKKEEISATITIPVNFSRRQQKMVELAAQNAGFHVDAVITEPFAALFYLMMDSFDSDGGHNVLIADFGGGTIDLCLAEIVHKEDKTRIETQSTVGISYGGNNVNEDILEHLLKKRSPEKLKQALEEPDNVLRRAVNKYFIMDAIDAMKEELFEEDAESDEAAEMCVLLFDGSVVDFGSFSVQDIYDMFDSQGWEKRMFQLLDELFADSSSLTPDEITDVFVIGGTSSIPYFRERIFDYFLEYGHSAIDRLFTMNDDMDQDDRIYSAVSKGAAIYNEMMENEEVEIRDRIPFLVYSKDENNKECTRISLDVCYEGYSSVLAPLTEKMKADRKINIYQKIYGENEKEVFLGEVEIDDEIADNATLYRLVVDQHRNIQAEFGYVIDDEEGVEESFCRDWCVDLAISL